MGNDLAVINNFNFNGSNIFTIRINDKVWFWGKQIALLLMYERPGDAINSLVKPKHCLTLKQSAFGKLPKAKQLWNGSDHSSKKMIDVSGVFSLVLRSTLPAAEDFQDWVTDDVLPEIQTTGSYNGNQSQLPQTPQEVTKALLTNLDANNEDIKSLKTDVKDLKDNQHIDSGEYNYLSSRVPKKVYKYAKYHGINSIKENDKIKALFKDINRQIREVAGVRTRTQIKAKDYESVNQLIDDWEPTTATRVLLNQTILNLDGGDDNDDDK